MAQLKIELPAQRDAHSKSIAFPARPEVRLARRRRLGLLRPGRVARRQIHFARLEIDELEHLEQQLELGDEQQQQFAQLDEREERQPSNSNSNSNSTNSNNSNTDSKNNNVETNNKEEHFERFEKIERVESGDAVQKELEKFKVYGLIFACSILSLLIFLAVASHAPAQGRREHPTA